MVKMTGVVLAIAGGITCVLSVTHGNGVGTGMGAVLLLVGIAAVKS